MKILAIESSCDETAAAVVEGRAVVSNIVATQIAVLCLKSPRADIVRPFRQWLTMQ